MNGYVIVSIVALCVCVQLILLFIQINNGIKYSREKKRNSRKYYIYDFNKKAHIEYTSIEFEEEPSCFIIDTKKILSAKLGDDTEWLSLKLDFNEQSIEVQTKKNIYWCFKTF